MASRRRQGVKKGWLHRDVDDWGGNKEERNVDVDVQGYSRMRRDFGLSFEDGTRASQISIDKYNTSPDAAEKCAELGTRRCRLVYIESLV